MDSCDIPYYSEFPFIYVRDIAESIELQIRKKHWKSWIGKLRCIRDGKFRTKTMKLYMSLGDYWDTLGSDSDVASRFVLSSALMNAFLMNSRKNRFDGAKNVLLDCLCGSREFRPTAEELLGNRWKSKMSRFVSYDQIAAIEYARPDRFWNYVTNNSIDTLVILSYGAVPLTLLMLAYNRQWDGNVVFLEYSPRSGLYKTPRLRGNLGDNNMLVEDDSFLAEGSTIYKALGMYPIQHAYVGRVLSDDHVSRSVFLGPKEIYGI